MSLLLPALLVVFSLLSFTADLHAQSTRPSTQAAPASKIHATTNPTGKRATTQPEKTIPSIGGVWQSGDDFLTISQENGTWKTELSYYSAKDGQIKLEIKDGMITVDGKLSGRVQYRKAPDSWGKGTVFHGQLSKDHKTISGPTWENHLGKFTWTATDPTIPLEILKAIVKHTLALGMTLEQCNKAIGSSGKLIETDGIAKKYEWSTFSPGFEGGWAFIRDSTGAIHSVPGTNETPIYGTIQDGKLVSFANGEPVFHRN